MDAGICGVVTKILTSSTDGQTVTIEYATTPPHAAKARDELSGVDACVERLKKPHETGVQAALSKHLPLVTCPLYADFQVGGVHADLPYIFVLSLGNPASGPQTVARSPG